MRGRYLRHLIKYYMLNDHKLFCRSAHNPTTFKVINVSIYRKFTAHNSPKPAKYGRYFKKIQFSELQLLRFNSYPAVACR